MIGVGYSKTGRLSSGFHAELLGQQGHLLACPVGRRVTATAVTVQKRRHLIQPEPLGYFPEVTFSRLAAQRTIVC
jgi:hypothetical protein